MFPTETLKHIQNDATLIQTLFLCPAAMSSYLFIVKSELPLVIQAFLGQTSTSEWVIKLHSKPWTASLLKWWSFNKPHHINYFWMGMRLGCVWAVTSALTQHMLQVALEKFLNPFAKRSPCHWWTTHWLFGILFLISLLCVEGGPWAECPVWDWTS